MRKNIEYTFKNPIDGKITKTVIEHFYIGSDIEEQIKMLFDTRVAPLGCLICYKEI